MGILFWNLLSESISNFGWSGVVENWFQSQIWKENTRISILIFFKSFGQYQKKI